MTPVGIEDVVREPEQFPELHRVTTGHDIPDFLLFGGFGLEDSADDYEAIVAAGYENGVPMGGDLQESQGDSDTPVFVVWALRDPNGANLDRIQIIKGWVGNDGDLKETIIDVAWSGDRQQGADSKLSPIGNSVDLTTATYTNDIGDVELMGTWQDREFDPSQHAMYYVRVLQIPTPRWSTYDAVRANLPLLEDVPATVQERAWTSPIWYKPGE